MGHAEELAGPFGGDPRLVLKKLADDADAVVQLGFLIGSLNGTDSSDEVWPAIPGSGIDQANWKEHIMYLIRCR